VADFVLVHDAWHGGWCDRDTAKGLRDIDHSLATPAHAGVAERITVPQ
jgi:hypothetical protein